MSLIYPVISIVEETVSYLTKEQEKDRSRFVDPETDQDLEVVENTLLLEWLSEN